MARPIPDNERLVPAFMSRQRLTRWLVAACEAVGMAQADTWRGCVRGWAQAGSSPKRVAFTLCHRRPRSALRVALWPPSTAGLSSRGGSRRSA